MTKLFEAAARITIKGRELGPIKTKELSSILHAKVHSAQARSRIIQSATPPQNIAQAINPQDNQLIRGDDFRREMEALGVLKKA